MRRVGIKALKNSLSEYVRAASAGETVLVTDRDRVVAELAPPTDRRAGDLSPALARGVLEGWYTPPTDPRSLSEVDEDDGEDLIPFDQLMRDLASDREDR